MISARNTMRTRGSRGSMRYQGKDEYTNHSFHIGTLRETVEKKVDEEMKKGRRNEGGNSEKRLAGSMRVHRSAFSIFPRTLFNRTNLPTNLLNYLPTYLPIPSFPPSLSWPVYPRTLSLVRLVFTFFALEGNTKKESTFSWR